MFAEAYREADLCDKIDWLMSFLASHSKHLGSANQTSWLARNHRASCFTNDGALSRLATNRGRAIAMGKCSGEMHRGLQ